MAINVKQILADALLSLSEEKPLAKITVSNIVSRANTGRQTFYNHFKDKNDLIYWIFCRTLRGERQLMQNAGYYTYLKKLYTEAQNYRSFLKQACALEGQNCLAEAIVLQTYDYHRKYIENHYGIKVFNEELYFSLMFHAYGAANMYIRWAEKGMPGSGEEQATYALNCMPDCIKKYLPLGEFDK